MGNLQKDREGAGNQEIFYKLKPSHETLTINQQSNMNNETEQREQWSSSFSNLTLIIIISAIRMENTENVKILDKANASVVSHPISCYIWNLLYSPG